MKRKIKKQLSLLLTALLLLFYVVYPPLIYAQEVTPTDTPTPTTTVDNSATTTTTTDTTTNTGGNAINPSPTDTPTPTIDPSTAPTDAPTPTVDPSVTPADAPIPTTTTIDNSATVSADLQSNANTGDNSITSSSGNNSSPSTSAIGTGDATSATSVVNSVNTTSVNSSIVNQTVNIFIAQDGNLNLVDPFTIAENEITAHPQDAVINVSVTNVNNYAYVTSDVASLALTGQNTIAAPNQNATIITGNAFSAVSLLNQVNFTVINSQIHLININIFGNLNGNIILPDPNPSGTCPSCGVSTTVNNAAAVTNNVSSTADTGNNSIIASGSAMISTGNAQSAVNALNIVNTNVLGTNAEILYINDLGTWNGNFIGWGNFDPTSGGASLALSNFSPNGNGSNSAQTTINNSAIVQNNISSLASSGGNSINGGNSLISTGNSFSAISLMNFINSNFINSFGFFGFINIFGNWTGNIGGASQFAALNTQDNNSTPPPTTISNDSPTSATTDTVQAQGGQLSVENANNVGAFVYPGDTVTFFIKVRNTGIGKVYSGKLNLNLILNGQTVGIASFNLNDIDAQKGVKVTTGIVLPKNAAGGIYTARAVATGNVGPDNSQISAQADSTFNVFGNFTAYAGNPHNPQVAVLGARNRVGTNIIATKASQDSPYLLSIILVLLAYVLIRGIRKRKYLKNLLESNDFKAKLASLRMFLF